MHLRPPSIDRGTSSGLWGVGLGLFLFVAMLSIGVSRVTAFIVSALAAFAIFLYVRLYGEPS